MRDRFRAWGYRADAYAIEAKPEVAGEVLPYRRLFRETEPGDLLVLHFGIGDDAYDRLARLPARKVLVYHNITPAEFFEGTNPHAALHVKKGRAQLRALAPAIDLAIGVSEYNRGELARAGYVKTAVVPIIVDGRRYDVAPDEAVLARWRGSATKILFVGRIAPNKRQDALVRLLSYHRRCVDPEAQLLLVGGSRDQPQYAGRVRALVERLGLDRAVHFTGPVSDAELAAYYSVATAFVSLSEHEGFAMPVLEAFRFGAPVVALDAAAVGETAGGAAVLIKERELPLFSEAVGLIAERPALREALVTAGRHRLKAFASDAVAERLREVLAL